MRTIRWWAVLLPVVLGTAARSAAGAVAEISMTGASGELAARVDVVRSATVTAPWLASAASVSTSPWPAMRA